jgi:hypothetical protein
MDSMRVGIITTYPEKGSRNIGDHLITVSTEAAVRTVVGECQFSRVFRADDWNTVQGQLQQVDHIVIACLAVRENGMFTRVYPYAEKLLDLGVPYTILSAGTELPLVHRTSYQWAGTAQDLKILQRFLRGAAGASSRGILTQRFLAHMGVDSPYLGDIAFFDPRYCDRRYAAKKSIRRIAISDPHYWMHYYHPLVGLRNGLQSMFPEAQIEVLLHGKSGLRKQLDREGISYQPIYENPKSGLDCYDEFDLHVGFRVHGHVSALKRCRPSYLLEQDGRGADYGASFNVNCTVPCYQVGGPLQKRVSKFIEYCRLPHSKKSEGSLPGSLFRILAMIDQHRQSGFQNFVGLDSQIQNLNQSNLEFLGRSMNQYPVWRRSQAA